MATWHTSIKDNNMYNTDGREGVISRPERRAVVNKEDLELICEVAYEAAMQSADAEYASNLKNIIIDVREDVKLRKSLIVGSLLEIFYFPIDHPIITKCILLMEAGILLACMSL